MTKYEAAVIMAYTGTATLQGMDLEYFYKYVKSILNRDVCTHELPELADEIRDKSEKDFMDICEKTSLGHINHARWVDLSKYAGRKEIMCSNCRTHFIGFNKDKNWFCPSCKSIMDGDKT